MFVPAPSSNVQWPTRLAFAGKAREQIAKINADKFRILLIFIGEPPKTAFRSWVDDGGSVFGVADFIATSFVCIFMTFVFVLLFCLRLFCLYFFFLFCLARQSRRARRLSFHPPTVMLTGLLH